MGMARDRYGIIGTEMRNTMETEIENTRKRKRIRGTEMGITIL